MHPLIVVVLIWLCAGALSAVLWCTVLTYAKRRAEEAPDDA